MNSAPAELLHPLIDAALQPLLARIFSQLPGWEEEFAPPLGCDPWPKKRWRLCQRRNSVTKRLVFPKKTPPNPT